MVLDHSVLTAMFFRWATFAAVVLVVVPSAGCGGDASPTLGRRAGFAEGSSLLYRTDRELDCELDGIAATGARYLRVEFDWGVVEPQRGHRDWHKIDRVVNGARRRGLRVVGLLAYTPPWARPPGTGSHTPPSNPQDFANFARGAVVRFTRAVSTWEVWNEPNIPGFWAPAANPGAYTALLRATSAAIKATDPRATVLTGGTAPSADGNGAISPVVFLQGIYAAGGRSSFDAVAHHPYSYPYLPLRPTTDFNNNAFAGVTPLLHEVMVSHGDSDKLIWGTEMGAPTIGPRRPYSLAAYLTQAYAAWTRWRFTGPLLWYSYRDAGTSKDPEDHFGLVRHDFTPKQPALERFTRLMGNMGAHDERAVANPMGAGHRASIAVTSRSICSQNRPGAKFSA